MKGTTGRSATSGILKDTEEEKQRVSALRTTAMLDPLTQVLNVKSATRDEIAMRLGMSSAQSESHNAFLLYDIDNFKQVNDTHGHMVGDEVLVKVANTLKESANSGYRTRWGASAAMNSWST